MGGTRFVTMRYKGWGVVKMGEVWCYVIIEWPLCLILVKRIGEKRRENSESMRTWTISSVLLRSLH